MKPGESVSLKPCPKCGVEDLWVHAWSDETEIECQGCGFIVASEEGIVQAYTAWDAISRQPEADDASKNPFSPGRAG